MDSVTIVERLNILLRVYQWQNLNSRYVKIDFYLLGTRVTRIHFDRVFNDSDDLKEILDKVLLRIGYQGNIIENKLLNNIV